MEGKKILQWRTALQAKYQQDMARLMDEQASLERETKKLDAERRRQSKGPRVGSARLLELKAQLAAFSTYDEFPYEREKQRVLASLKE